MHIPYTYSMLYEGVNHVCSMKGTRKMMCLKGSLRSVVKAMTAVAGFVFGMQHVLDDETVKLYSIKRGKLHGMCGTGTFVKHNICPDNV